MSAITQRVETGLCTRATEEICDQYDQPGVRIARRERSQGVLEIGGAATVPCRQEIEHRGHLMPGFEGRQPGAQRIGKYADGHSIGTVQPDVGERGRQFAGVVEFARRPEIHARANIQQYVQRQVFFRGIKFEE